MLTKIKDFLKGVYRSLLDAVKNYPLKKAQVLPPKAEPSTIAKRDQN